MVAGRVPVGACPGCGEHMSTQAGNGRRRCGNCDAVWRPEFPSMDSTCKCEACTGTALGPSPYCESCSANDCTSYRPHCVPVHPTNHRQDWMLREGAYP